LLAAFRAVVETGNFTRAAERLRRNQSTLSMQIKRLETAVGDKLLERGAGTAVRLTARGEIVLTYARRLLALQEEALAALRDGDLQGTVRLGTPEDFATAHLPQVLADFARSHPQVALEITCDLTLNLLDRLGRGEFDLALIKREPAGDAGGVPVWRAACALAPSLRLSAAGAGGFGGVGAGVAASVYVRIPGRNPCRRAGGAWNHCVAARYGAAWADPLGECGGFAASGRDRNSPDHRARSIAPRPAVARPYDRCVGAGLIHKLASAHYRAS
jgi:DNA-binding transcriptional LysR family regulator